MIRIYKNICFLIVFQITAIWFSQSAIMAQDDVDEVIVIKEVILEDGDIDISNPDDAKSESDKSSQKDETEESVYEIRQRVERAQKERLELLKILGAIYKEIDKPDEAIEMYKKALDMDPSDNELFKIVLDQYQKNQNWHELIPIYQQLIDKYKGDNAEYYQKLVELYIKTGRDDKTFETVESYLNEHNGKEETYIYAIDVYIIKDKNDEALRTATSGIAKFPKSVNLQIKASDIYTRMENYTKALECLETAKSLTTNAEIKNSVERRLMHLYEKADIVKEIIARKTSELQNIESELKDLYLKQARNKEESGRYADAIAIYKKLRLLAPDTPEGTLAVKKIKELQEKTNN